MTEFDPIRDMMGGQSYATGGEDAVKTDEQYQVCGRCNGHNWIVWMEPLFREDDKVAVIKACEACNCDGKKPPMDFHGYEGSRNQL